jgi:hypothetical protein
MRISIPLDLSSQPFIPLSRFIRSRRSRVLILPLILVIPKNGSIQPANYFSLFLKYFFESQETARTMGKRAEKKRVRERVSQAKRSD